MIEYRQFQPEDMEQCRALFLSCVDDYTGVGPGGHEKFRKAIGEKYRTSDYLSSIYCIVAVEDGQVVGIGGLDGNGIKRMRVSPQRRNEGIGKAIYEKLEVEARYRGLQSLNLNSSMNAVGFYEGMGFSRVREKIWDFDGVTVKNVVMEKELK